MGKIMVVVKLRIEGIHRWSECGIKQVDFLRQQHRHVFHITAKKEVGKTDREIEIIVFKREIEEWIKREYACDKHVVVDFGENSCEDIACALALEFGLQSCVVLEDGEAGGMYCDI